MKDNRWYNTVGLAMVFVPFLVILIAVLIAMFIEHPMWLLGFIGIGIWFGVGVHLVCKT